MTYETKRRKLDADALQQILRRMDLMTAALDRLTASVASVGTAVSGVATAIRNHPAAADDSGQLTAPASELLACLQAAGLISNEREKAIKLDFAEGVLSATACGAGQMTSAIPGTFEGELPKALGLKVRYFSDICEQFKDCNVTLRMTDEAMPVSMTAVDSPLLAVLMPVRL